MLGQAAPRLSTAWVFHRPRLTDAFLRQVALLLVGAAVLEVTLLRLTTRIGVHVPHSEPVGGALRAASFLGTLAFNSASILAIGILGLVVLLAAFRSEQFVSGLALAVLGGALALSLVMSLAVGAATWDLAFGAASVTLAVLFAMTLLTRRDAPANGRLALALIVGAYLCYQYYSLSQIAYRALDYTALPPLGIETLRWGEALVVFAAGAAFWAWGVPRWRLVGAAGGALVVGVPVIVGLSMLTPSSTTAILALWTTGMSFALPAPLYLLALLLYLLTIVACFRDRSAFWTGAGLLLLLVAGYMPEATYHHLLVVLGIGFLAGINQADEQAAGPGGTADPVHPASGP